MSDTAEAANSRSQKPEVRCRIAEVRRATSLPPSPQAWGEGRICPPISDLRVPQSDTEELYRKTLEELKRLRSQAPSNEKNIGQAPQAINEALIQASGKGKLLGEEAGRMGAGKNDQIQDSNLQNPNSDNKNHQ